jgi:hypothetical protein
VTVLRGRRASPAAVALIAVAVCALYAAVAVRTNHSAASFAQVGSVYAGKSRASATIDTHFHPVARYGYDGQFFLAIALDPVRARHYLDAPSYRYSHIVYPLLARAVAFGRAGWIPIALILVNIAAVAVGTFFAAMILRRAGYTPLLALLYLFFPGLLFAFARDLSEPLAYALALAGIFVLSNWKGWRQIIGAGTIFGIAGITRETPLLIAVTLACVHVLDKRRREGVGEAVAFATLALLPYAALRVFLYAWLGHGGGSPQATVGPVPFSGLAAVPVLQVGIIISVVLPGTALLLIGLGAIKDGWRSGTLPALLVSIVLMTLYLPEQSYFGYLSAGRLQLGTVVLTIASLRCLTRNAWSKPALTIATALAYFPLVSFIATFARTGVGV